jgi:hypothetical protein
MGREIGTKNLLIVQGKDAIRYRLIETKMSVVATEEGLPRGMCKSTRCNGRRGGDEELFCLKSKVPFVTT